MGCLPSLSLPRGERLGKAQRSWPSAPSPEPWRRSGASLEPRGGEGQGLCSATFPWGWGVLADRDSSLWPGRGEAGAGTWRFQAWTVMSAAPEGRSLSPGRGSWNLLEGGWSALGLRELRRRRLRLCVRLGSGWRGGRLRTREQVPGPRTARRPDASPGGQAAREAGPAGGASLAALRCGPEKRSCFLLPAIPGS